MNFTPAYLAKSVSKETGLPAIRDQDWLEERKNFDADLDELKHETPEEKTMRLRQDQENRSFLEDVLEAFDFHLVGEEVVAGRPAYVIQATPHPDCHAGGKYAKIFPRVEGKLWVDKQDFGRIKVDGQATESFSMGLFVARVQQGSHVIVEQRCVGDGRGQTALFCEQIAVDLALTKWPHSASVSKSSQHVRNI